MNGKITWIIYLRVFATFAVVVIHSASQLLYNFSSDDIKNWWIGNLYDSASRFCVPVFVMISGALILPKINNPLEFYHKKLLRIVIPFIFWSAIYIIYNLIFIKDLSTINEIIIYFVSQFFKGSAFHFWYIYMIIGLFLFAPFLSRWLQNSSEKEVRIFLIIWAISILLQFPLLNNYFPAIDFTHISGYLGYLVLGYYLTKYSSKISEMKSIYLIAFYVFSFIITAFGTFYLTSYSSNFSDEFYKYITPNILIMSVSIFVFFKNTFSQYKVSIIINYLDKYSYEIFLSHIPVLQLVKKYLSQYFTETTPLFTIPITVITCISLSFFIVFLLNKTTYGKYISKK